MTSETTDCGSIAQRLRSAIEHIPRDHRHGARISVSMEDAGEILRALESGSHAPGNLTGDDAELLWTAANHLNGELSERVEALGDKISADASRRGADPEGSPGPEMVWVRVHGVSVDQAGESGDLHVHAVSLDSKPGPGTWVEYVRADLVQPTECRSVSRKAIDDLADYMNKAGKDSADEDDPASASVWWTCEGLVRALGRASTAEQESIADDSDLIDEDPLPSAHADDGFWQWRSYPDGTYDAKAPGAISWVERLRSRRDVWAVLHGWVDIARTTEEKSVDQGGADE